MMALTPKQERFVEEYLVDLNGTQAAIRAGYSAKTAEQQAFQLLQKTTVSEAISRQRAKVSERAEVDTVRVVRELARVAFSDVRKVFASDGSIMHPRDLDDATAAAVSSVEFDPDGGFKIKLWDKNSAADKLMRHLGGYEKDNKQPGEGLAEAISRIERIVVDK